MFPARLPSIFSTSHELPRLPRNLHLVATWRSPANAIRKKTRNTTRLKCCACHAKWRWTRPVLRLPRKLQRIFWKRRKSIVPATQNDFRHVTKHIWMSRSATPAKRNEATRSLKPPKMTTSDRTYHRHGQSRARLRTVANGCGHKRNVERTHPQPPDPQSETGTLATHSGRTDRIHEPNCIWVADKFIC